MPDSEDVREFRAGDLQAHGNAAGGEQQGVIADLCAGRER